MEYTDVIVGAGSAGCVMAERLSSASDRRVLVIEAGRHYRSVDTPSEVASPNNFRVVSGSDFMWPLEAKVTASQVRQPFHQGRGVGGSSAVNNTWALRARPGDLAQWEQAGCRGVSWSDLAVSYRATERDLDFGSSASHGDSGPLTISRLEKTEWSPVDVAFSDAVLAAGFSWSADLNDADSVGAGPIPMTISGNRRVSANDAFLDPAIDRPNLELHAETLVHRIVFEGTLAIGVAILRDGHEDVVRADNVILSAGAVQSPALLLRSGVGPADALGAVGLKTIVDVPGVGTNLVEHPMVGS